MAGYWLRLIFAKRKNGSTRPIFSHLDRPSLVNKGLKVAEHSFGSLKVYVICQIIARERLQLTS